MLVSSQENWSTVRELAALHIELDFVRPIYHLEIAGELGSGAAVRLWTVSSGSGASSS